MHKPQIKRIALAVLCAFPVAAGAQQGLQLKTQPTLILVPPTVRDELPIFLEADRVQGHSEKEVEAIGSVRLRRRGSVVHADRLRYEQPTDKLTAEGSVRIERGPDAVEGTRLEYSLATERGFMERPSFLVHRSREADGKIEFFRETDGRGNAERLFFEGPDQYLAQRAQYTACAPGNDDWYLRAGELRIDKGRDVGEARDASIVFMGVPLFYSPYLSFPLGQERKSGFVTPHYGSSDKGGAEFTLPYYWNIAPNRDLTISPRIMTRRGVLVHNEFRYLEPNYLGTARADILPEDDARNGQQRWAYNLQHQHTLPSGWFGHLNLQKVSDDTYFTDLSTQIAATSQVLLPREGSIGRYGSWGETGNYAFSGLVQRWQTLQADPLALVTPPYNRQPQLTLNAARPELFRHSDLDFYGHYVGFDHPTLVNGRRALAYPSLSVPLQTPYAYLTPKAGLNVTRYELDANGAGVAEQHTRSLPIFSADSGVVFERPARIGGVSFLQTLEPRIYYLNIPFRDQSRIPVFDSGLQDINLATIFSENQFGGWDRINDANQVTYGVTSRLIRSANGAQLLSGAVAQRYYFETQRVTLPGVPVRTSSSSDLLAAASGTVAPHWTADVGWQYSTNFSQTQKFNIGTRYQPQPGKVLNLSYRETLNVLRQTDISTQWPIGRWTALARWNYSLLDQRTLEGLVGAEYNGDCWALRIVAHRFAVATQQASTTLFVQLELNGVSRIGSNPLDTIRNNIGGYVRIDPRAPLPDESRNPYY
jgi:LPS-assembly protein